MQKTLQHWLTTGLVICLMAGGARAADSPQDFVLQDQLAAVARASRAIIYDIGWMRRTPKVIDDSDWDGASKTLSLQDTADLRRWMAEARRLDRAPDPAQCHFAPGFQIRFLDDERKTLETLLICLNCNVFAIADTGPKAASTVNRYRIDMVPSRYGDALAHRAELLALVARYFPNH